VKTRLFLVALLSAVLVILIFGLTGGVTAQRSQHLEKPEMKLSTNLTLVSISPISFANGVNLPVTIMGSNLDTVVSATLGTVALRNLEIVSSTQVTALIPWSIVTGTYDLKLTDSNGLSATLTGAVTVTQGDLNWTSNGPYGGGLYNIVIDPVDASRMYVSAGRSGLWRSQNGGTSWDFSLITPFPRRVQIAYPTPGQPPIMYLGNALGVGAVVRSLDYGQTWESKGLTTTTGEINAFVRPGQPNWVYASVDQDDPFGGLYKSTDQGEHWAIVSGTSGLRVNAVAFDPDHPNLNIVIGTASGQVYTTTDDGVTWSNPITLANRIGQLYFAPTLYNGKRSLFAMPCTYELSCDNDEDVSYQSTDGGQTWITLTVAPTPNNNNGRVSELTFHDSIPGLMWAAVGDGYYSEDGGATWQPVGGGLHKAGGSFAVVPGGATRQTTTLFAVFGDGLYKSTDGGDSWQETDTGIGAVLARAIAISPFNADEAYIAAGTKGLLHTFDGGRNWQSLPAPIGRFDAPIAPDPFIDGRVYFGYGTRVENTPTVRVSSDHGFTFTEHTLTLPPKYAGQSAGVAAIAPDPQTPNRLLAGVCRGDSGFGLIYASTDGGVTWIQQTILTDTKCISQLIFDPNNPNVVYAGTYGSGLLRSTDGGATWSLLEHQASTNYLAVEIDPKDSNSIYIATGNTHNGVPSGVFATHDGGDTWLKMTGAGGTVWAVKLCKVGVNNWLYAATMDGLRYLKTIPDDPTSQWESATGIAATATVDGFNCATEDGRVVSYIGTSGGIVNTSLSVARQPTAAAGSKNMGGGIYRAMLTDSQYESLYGTLGWKLSNRSGFGKHNNQIFALEVFNGQLYAATAGAEGRVWRLTQANTWTPSSEVGMSSTYSQTNDAIFDLVTFNGQLYASISGATEGQIWRTANGTDWNKVTSSEFISNRTATVMVVFSNTLYAATSAAAVEIWRSSTGNSGSWQPVMQDSFGNPNNSYVSGAAVMSGTLYFSVVNGVDGITIWRTTNGITWTQASTYGFGNAANAGAGGLATLNGYLYAGTRNDTTGGQIWRYNGTTWSQVVADGFGNVNNFRIDSLYTINNWLFAVARNSTTGLQVRRTTNGTDWTALNLNGLGNTKNVGTIWSNASTAFANSFYLGTANGAIGGEIWQYSIYPISVYLPLVRK
jgi:hypothetical protein